MAHILSQFFNIERTGSWNAYFTYIAAESAAVSSNQTSNEGKKPENRPLNRYRDVLPFDSSLVSLEGNPSYINANLVRYEPADRTYILTQGPLPNTISHFWKMIWQRNCSAVIMLNRIIEKGRPKCSPYFPVECSLKDIVFDGITSEDTSVLRLEDAGLMVELDSEIHYESFVKRNLLLTKTDTGETRELCHFNYMDWPDFGEPSCPKSFLCFLSLLRECNVFDKIPVIHCSAGIGRSGAFILVDIVLAMLAKCVEATDVEPSEILLCLRGQRAGLVQTPDQLRFCYITILHAFTDPKLQICPKWIDEIIHQLSLISDGMSGRIMTRQSAPKEAEDDSPEAVCRQVLEYLVESCSNPKEYTIPVGNREVLRACVLGSQLTSLQLSFDFNECEEEEEEESNENCIGEYMHRSSNSVSSLDSASTTTSTT